METKNARTGVGKQSFCPYQKAALQRRTPQRGRDSFRLSRPSSLSFARTSPHLSLTKKSGSEIFTSQSRWCYCAKTIMAAARVLVFLLFVFHLPAARGPGLDRLGQARHLAAAAAAAGAVVAEAADH
jgi:hypothetical protein